MTDRFASAEEQSLVFRSLRSKNGTCFDCATRNPVSRRARAMRRRKRAWAGLVEEEGWD